MTKDIIRTEGLSRCFGDTVAVKDLNLTVLQGQVFGFLGPNGAGKTTTVRLLNGVLTPSSGTAIIMGMDVRTASNDIRRQTGVLTESPNLYDALTARENLLFFGELYGVEQGLLPGRADDLLDEFDLGARAEDRVGTFSKGMKQRLAIARALLHRPALLFLDEPTAGLDPAASRMVTGMIQDLSHREGRTTFLCTHNLAEAQRLCDRVGVIADGRLRAIGTPQDLARQLWHDLWIEIDLHGPPSAGVREALDALPAVQSQHVNEGSLLLELGDEEDIPEVIAAIVRAGGRVYGVRPREHTLEEIYFRIQGERESAPASAAESVKEMA